MVDKKFIDGSHYEDQYANIDTEYFGLYVANGIPTQAVGINQYYADLAIMMFNLEPGAKILDAGCGVGHSMRPFLRRGFKCHGIEVSESARRYSPYRDDITIGNISDMYMFKKDQFDLVFSHGTMEHIDRSVVDWTVKELRRVGLRQFHVISTDPVSPEKDPGHITIENHKWWMNKFGEGAEPYYMVGVCYDPLMADVREPIVFALPAAFSTVPLRRFFQANNDINRAKE